MEVMNEGGQHPKDPPHTPQSLTWARSPSYLYSQVNAASSKRFSSSPTPRAGWASMGFRGTPVGGGEGQDEARTPPKTPSQDPQTSPHPAVPGVMPQCWGSFSSPCSSSTGTMAA